MAAKKARKLKLTAYLKKETGYTVNPDAMFDIQVTPPPTSSLPPSPAQTISPLSPPFPGGGRPVSGFENSWHALYWSPCKYVCGTSPHFLPPNHSSQSLSPSISPSLFPPWLRALHPFPPPPHSLPQTHHPLPLPPLPLSPLTPVSLPLTFNLFLSPHNSLVPLTSHLSPLTSYLLYTYMTSQK